MCKEELQMLQNESRQVTDKLVQNLKELAEILDKQNSVIQQLYEQIKKQKEQQEQQKQMCKAAQELETRRQEELNAQNQEFKELLVSLTRDVQTMREEFGQVKQLEAERESNLKEISRLETQLGETRAELEEANKHLENQENFPSELQEIYQGYQKFCAWKEQDQKEDPLIAIRSDNFFAFFYSCTSESAFGQIFTYVKRFIWDTKRTEDLNAVDQLIDICIRIKNLTSSNEKRLKRQTTQVGEEYDYTRHAKPENAPATGSVKKVRLQGVVEADSNKVVKDCKTFVEVE